MEQNSITFDQLPKEVYRQGVLLEQLLKIIKDLNLTDKPTDVEFLTAAEAAQFLNYTVGTLKKKSNLGEIPRIVKGKKLYFLKEDLINFLKSGRRKSLEEIQEEADQFKEKRR